MSMVKSVDSMKDQSGKKTYRCLMNNGTFKWLEKHKIANFNEVPNIYADKVYLDDSVIKRTKAETKGLADITMKKTGSSGLKKILYRNGYPIYIIETENGDFDTVYGDEEVRRNFNLLYGSLSKFLY